MRSRSTRSVLVAAVLVAASVTAGCSTSDGSDEGADSAGTSTSLAPGSAPGSTSASGSGSSPSTAPTVAPSVAPTTTVPTSAPPVASFPTPTAAGAALFGAWTRGDRAGAGALGLAPTAELDKLFANAARPAAKNRGCDDGEFGSASCFFGNDQGGVNVTLAPAPGGWTISSIDPFG